VSDLACGDEGFLEESFRTRFVCPFLCRAVAFVGVVVGGTTAVSKGLERRDREFLLPRDLLSLICLADALVCGLC
jgi:hypothetical protein